MCVRVSHSPAIPRLWPAGVHYLSDKPSLDNKLEEKRASVTSRARCCRM